MKRAVIVGVAAAALMSVGLGAQGRNFSGTWTIDSEKTMAANAGVAGGGGRGGGGAVAAGGTIERRVADPTTAGAVAVAGGGGGARGGGGGGAVMARSGASAGPVGTTITLDTKSFSVTQGETTTAYALDGSVSDISNAMRKATAKAAWQGDKLVIQTTVEGANGPVATQATWYLEGESLVRENSSTGPDGQAMTRKTYFKKQ